MGKIKVGILIFTNKVKERALSADVFDNKNYYGLKSIIGELNNNFDIQYISTISINTCDYVLIPIISYYDALNYINEIYGKVFKAKIIVGGPYVLNYHTFSNAFAVVIGRCEDMINGIFNKEKYTNVVYPDALQENYEVGSVKRFLCVGDRNEVAVGCAAKCFFCQYAWKNKYTSIVNSGYNSNLSKYEDYIQNLKATKNGRYVTAIDGLTERTRYLVNKKISNNVIVDKLSEIAENDIAGMVKIYNIVAYPWEQNVNFEEFIECVNKSDKNNKNKLTIYLTHTHFVPKLFTPMEDMQINMLDARNSILKNPIIYRGKYFKVANNISITSNVSAIEEYIVDRADNEIDILLIAKIICTNKYKGLNNKIKLKVLQKYFDKYINGYIGHYRMLHTYNIAEVKKNINKKIINGI
jgi:hypothetical protein